MPAQQPEFTKTIAVARNVMRGDRRHIATAVSSSTARRIAKALNLYYKHAAHPPAVVERFTASGNSVKRDGTPIALAASPSMARIIATALNNPTSDPGSRFVTAPEQKEEPDAEL